MRTVPLPAPGDGGPFHVVDGNARVHDGPDPGGHLRLVRRDTNGRRPQGGRPQQRRQSGPVPETAGEQHASMPREDGGKASRHDRFPALVDQGIGVCKRSSCVTLGIGTDRTQREPGVLDARLGGVAIRRLFEVGWLHGTRVPRLGRLAHPGIEIGKPHGQREHVERLARRGQVL